VWVGECSVFNKGNIHCIPFQGLLLDRKEAASRKLQPFSC